MKKTIALALALICALTVLLTLAVSCGGEETPSGTTYGVAFGGVTLTPDMDMATVLAAVTDTYKYSESSACPPFSGTEKLYDFSAVKITTYSKDGKDLIMGIFLKDDSVNVSGVAVGATVEVMKEKLGESYTESGAGNYVYTASNGAKLKCMVKNGAVVSIQLLTKEADS